MQNRIPRTHDVSILYERKLPQGPVVRIRRVPAASTAAAGAVCAVIEVDRRTGASRETSDDVPPALMAVEGRSEHEVVASLLPFAEDDSAVARLLAERGIR